MGPVTTPAPEQRWAAALNCQQMVEASDAVTVKVAEADVLAGNQPMLKVFERSGLPMHRRLDDGVVHVTLELDAATPGPAGSSSRSRAP